MSTRTSALSRMPRRRSGGGSRAWLEVLDRADGGDGTRESDVREAMHQSRYHGSLGVAHLEAGAAVGAELGRRVADRGQGTQHQEFTLGQAEPPRV
jgi:hypothetical protein